jgi:6-phospho-3-hexuloisomerase
VDFASMSQQVVSELGAALARIDDETPRRLCGAITQSRRIACHGVGREGLVMKTFAMRLFHLGFDVHVVGDVTTPPLAAGDLLIISVGPGSLTTLVAMMNVARAAGARVLLVTAQPDGKASQVADDVIVVPAQTMADDSGASPGRTPGASSSLLPMGSLYELAMFVFFDLISLMLRDQTDQTAEQMRRRHTNLE